MSKVAFILLFVGLTLHVFAEKLEESKKIDVITTFDIQDFFIFKDDFKKQGVDISVRDTFPLIRQVFYDPLQSEKIVVFNCLIDKEVLSRVPKKTLIYFLWEPWEVPIEYYQSFEKVYTWDDDLVDNLKFFKIHYPSLLPMEDLLIPFKEKKLCVMVSGFDLDPQGRNNDLCSERMRMVEFFETKPKKELEIYGRSWKSREYRDYLGEIPGFHSGKEKIAVLKQYRFSICFENTKNINGYVTEKIFSCFAAGCVPIYWGAKNVETYIPKGCFIDCRDFESKEKLYQFLKNMTESEYEKYIMNIRSFLKSEQAQVFSKERFQKCFLEIVKQ